MPAFEPAAPAYFLPRQELSGKEAFTAQYIAGYEERTALRFIEMHPGVNGLRYTRSLRSGKDWFVVFYGEFGSREEARAALAKLPASLRQEEPWIRTLGDI